MKKVFLVLFTIGGVMLAAYTANAQQPTLKIGVFDIDVMVQSMPGYPAIDSMVQTYERDSLGAEYSFYQSEYRRLDSTYKSDSAGTKPKSILTIEQQQRQQVAMNLVYWQQIAQNKSDQKRAALAQPLLEKVVDAYKKVLDAQKFNLILKPQSVERGTTAVTNIFQLVAAELKVPLAPELGGGQDQQDQGGQQSTAPSKPQSKSSGTTKPKQ